MLDTAAGAFHVAGSTQPRVGWADIAAQATDAGDAPLAAVSDFEQPDNTYAFGCHVAVVEIDSRTGETTLRRLVACDDAGTLINPLVAEGQVQGGIAQGVAQVLLEEMVYDADGNPMAANLVDYPAISAPDLPSFDLVPMETPTPLNPARRQGDRRIRHSRRRPRRPQRRPRRGGPPGHRPHRHARHPPDNLARPAQDPTLVGPPAPTTPSAVAALPSGYLHRLVARLPEYVVFDLETNADRPHPSEHEIIQIGAVLVSDEEAALEKELQAAFSSRGLPYFHVQQRDGRGWQIKSRQGSSGPGQSADVDADGHQSERRCGRPSDSSEMASSRQSRRYRTRAWRIRPVVGRRASMTCRGADTRPIL